MSTTTTLAERLFARLRVAESGCWEFTGSRDGRGYGRLSTGSWRTRNKRAFLTHRVAWAVMNGPIPEGLVICHDCDNPPCCNPDHLFLGTQKDNLEDMTAKGRRRSGNQRGPANANARLTVEQVRHVRASDATHVALAEEFRVTPRAIGLIRQGVTWRGVV